MQCGKEYDAFLRIISNSNLLINNLCPRIGFCHRQPVYQANIYISLLDKYTNKVYYI